MENRIALNEFKLLRDYIEEQCGISLGQDKQYLVETRLASLMIEEGCRNYSEFYHKARADRTLRLRDKVIDSMTTNETLWFRDRSPYLVMEEFLLKYFHDRIKKGAQSRVRVWSAACSTGQEPYSIAMTVHEYARNHSDFNPSSVEIIATDISPTVLETAKAGSYDAIAISRGLDEKMKARYFKKNGKAWIITDSVKSLVTFRKTNLQESFSNLGSLDIVFCRNVLIYFSESFKRDVLARIAQRLRPQGFLFLGASESMISYSVEYSMQRYNQALFYQVK